MFYFEEINGYKVLTYCSIINKITNNTDLNSDEFTLSNETKFAAYQTIIAVKDL